MSDETIRSLARDTTATDPLALARYLLARSRAPEGWLSRSRVEVLVVFRRERQQTEESFALLASPRFPRLKLSPLRRAPTTRGPSKGRRRRRNPAAEMADGRPLAGHARYYFDIPEFSDWLARHDRPDMRFVRWEVLP